MDDGGDRTHQDAITEAVKAVARVLEQEAKMVAREWAHGSRDEVRAYAHLILGRVVGGLE